MPPLRAPRLSSPSQGAPADKPRLKPLYFSKTIFDLTERHNGLFKLNNGDKLEDRFSGTVSYRGGFEEEVDRYISTVPGVQVTTDGYFKGGSTEPAGYTVTLRSKELTASGEYLPRQCKVSLFTRDTDEAKAFHDFVFNALQETQSTARTQTKLGEKYRGVESEQGGILYLVTS